MLKNSLLIPLILSFLCGGIAVLSYSPFDLWPLAFISFSGLLILANNHKAIKKTILISLIWGIGYFLSGIHWVYISIKQYGDLPTPLAIIILLLLVFYLSLYPTIFAVLLRLFNKIFPAFSFKQLIILAPLIWQVTEYLRATILNGFAWLQFGYSQLDSPLGSLIPIVGINGVNFIFSICCGLLTYVIYHFIESYKKNQTKHLLHTFSALCIIAVIFIASLWFKNITWTQLDYSRQTNITLVQGNIAQSLRWSRMQLNNTLNTYSRLTQEHIKDSDIIIWSEATITDLERNQISYLTALNQYANEHNNAIAVGILTQGANNDEIYNALIILGDGNSYQYPTEHAYLKNHLVPFGEYIPLESVLKPIANLLNIPMSSMSAGPMIQKPLTMKGFKFATVICYEVILSDLLWQNFQPDTDFILTVSNDAWFGNSIGPWQHLQMARARALEFGRTLLRSTNNGITAVINAQGIVSQQIPQFETDTLSIKANPNVGITPYSKWGNYPYYVICVLFILILFYRRKK